MSATFIRALNESNSRLHKEQVLDKTLVAAKLGNIPAQIFLGLANAVYNPLITWGVKQIPETTGIDDAPNPWTEFNTLLNQLHKRELTGYAARDAISAMSEQFTSDEWNNFCAPVLRKDLRCGITEKTINKVCKGTKWAVPVFSCQLATNCEDRPEMRGKKRLEPKIDGMRMLALCTLNDEGADVICYSRNGIVFENFGHIQEQLRKILPVLGSKLGYSSWMFDGEIMSASFQALMRQARRKKDVDIADAVYNIFDIVPLDNWTHGYWNAQLHKRIKLLNFIEPLLDSCPSVALLSHIDVDLDTIAGRQQLNKYGQQCVDEGFEGIMIKDLDAPYICKRSTSWLKWKPTITVDITIEGYEEGTGKNVGKLGAVFGRGVDSGRDFSVYVGGGYSDDDRDSLWRDRNKLPGRVMEVIADGVTQNQDGTFSLRFPRFYRFRDTFTGDKE